MLKSTDLKWELKQEKFCYFKTKKYISLELCRIHMTQVNTYSVACKYLDRGTIYVLLPSYSSTLDVKWNNE